MAWQNGMPQGNAWYGPPPPYPNYGSYGCPPGSSYVNGPPPVPPQQGWGPYPLFGGYAFPQQNNWPYGTPPPPAQNTSGGTFTPPASGQTEKKANSSTSPDVTKINPPLPPDPPPGEPPKKEEEKGKEEKTPKKEEEKKEKDPSPPSQAPPLPSSPQAPQAPPPPPPPKTEANPPPPPPPTSINPMTMPPPPYFDPSQFSVPPPPTSWNPMYQQPNPWYMYPNPNFQHMNQQNNNNQSTEQNATGPIKFSLPNKKGNLANSALASQSPLSQNDDDRENNESGQGRHSYYQQAMSGNFNDSNNKRKKNKKPGTSTGKQIWVQSSNLCSTDLKQTNNQSRFLSTNSYNKTDYGSNSEKKDADKQPSISASPQTPSIQSKCLPKTGKEPSAMISSAEWPQSLKDYVGKCFERCVTELDKDQVEICLKGKLTQAARNETLWTKDWSKEPLISVFSVLASEKKDTTADKDLKTSPRKIEGDPSRGFTLIRRSYSRSRSRSISPFPSESRRRRDRNRYDSTTSEEKGFLSFNSRLGREGQRGRGKRNRKGRAGQFNKDGGQFNKDSENSYFYSKSGSMTLDPDLATNDRLEKRAARFAGAQTLQRGGRNANKFGALHKKKKINLSQTINNTFTVDGDSIDWSSMHILGTSTVLEKQYLRLTSAPDPCTIRTLPTLKKALDHVKKLWIKNHDYHYACNQLKSIRQDLTVQGIRDEFTIQVYENHCRIALEKGDHEEFNQCQTQLKDLYATMGGENQLEFTAYRLLYYIFTSNTLDITSMMASLTEKDKQDDCVSFALKLRAAWSLSNYHQLFKLYQSSPKMTGYLIDWFAKRERERAIKVIIKSYRPGNLAADYVKSTLALSGEDWLTFVDDYKICFTDASNELIDCKQSTAAMAAV